MWLDGLGAVVGNPVEIPFFILTIDVAAPRADVDDIDRLAGRCRAVAFRPGPVKIPGLGPRPRAAFSLDIGARDGIVQSAGNVRARSEEHTSELQSLMRI